MRPRFFPGVERKRPVVAMQGVNNSLAAREVRFACAFVADHDQAHFIGAANVRRAGAHFPAAFIAARKSLKARLMPSSMARTIPGAISALGTS